ncbi:MAG: fumarylacetoacetate hydrolase family protein [Chloroflexi bacterium]|nr:fumarylacetoacetate hydrolase family protein [Chloroflexota bacterium]
MRLVSHLEGGVERLGVDRNGRVIAVSELLENGPSTMAGLLADPDALDRLRGAVTATLRSPTAGTPIEGLTLLAPVPRPGKIIAVGLNYADHAAEGGRPAPEEPVLFAKFPTAVVGPGAEITWDPTLTLQVDVEAELAVIIGRTARHVPLESALDHVLGYTCLNDVSARDLQLRDKQFTRAKSLDTFCPMGPALITADEITDPQALRISSTVDGEVWQDGTTADMIFPIAELIAFCSRAFTLEPGDVIATGTPAGVGLYHDPPRFLRDAARVVIEIDAIGRLSNRCREMPA